MMNRRTRLILLSASLFCGFAVQASAQQQAFFTYPTTTSSVLVDYEVEFRKMAEEDRSVRIRVFGDGRVELHRPFWHAKAGSFATQLTADEIQTLLDGLLTVGTFRFDPERTFARCRDEDKRRFESHGRLSGSSADSWIYLSVHVDGLQHLDSGAVEGPVEQRIAWRNLEWSAENYPSIPALKRLRTATRLLDALWQHEGLVEDGYTRGVGQ